LWYAVLLDDCHVDHLQNSTGLKLFKIIKCLILGWVFRIKLSDEDIADFEVLRDVAMATIFGFLYMGCTLTPPEEYD